MIFLFSRRCFLMLPIAIKNVEKIYEMNFVLHQKYNIFSEFLALPSINQNNVLYTSVLGKKRYIYIKRRCNYSKRRCVRSSIQILLIDYIILGIASKPLFIYYSLSCSSLPENIVRPEMEELSLMRLAWLGISNSIFFLLASS